ncbi:MAG: aldehyde dehydrogenase family protein [Solirubrobacteraceae bacterium]|nr:aldehyde dehydrogenase family protein [Solirubrobacteraceae bacterium]
MTDSTLAEVRTGLYINGEHLDASDTIAVPDPADPSQTVGYAAAATPEQARAAVEAADAAFPAWAALSPEERAQAVVKSLEGLAADEAERIDILSRENGKVRSECEAEMHVLAHRFQLAADLAPKLHEVEKLAAPPYNTEIRRLPLGVVTIIVPFNWPLAILGAALPYALVAGNTTVVKAPPTTPLSFMRTLETIAAALPPGVLNVISGRDADVGPAIIQDPRVKKVNFTGSVRGGQAIMRMASENLARITLELGGNDPAIILPDATFDEQAFGGLYAGAFLTTGQVCMAMKRMYVHRSLYDTVVEGLGGVLSAQKIGPGLDPESTMGPLHSPRQVEIVEGLLADVRGRAEIREYGEPVDEAAFERGQFLRPSLVLDPPADAKIVTEEQFGPTLPIIPYDDVEDAIRQANDTWSGLCSSVWGTDMEQVERVAARLRTGYTFINAHNAPWLDERVPFGGFNMSGQGREMGVEGLLAFTDTHSIGFPA